MFHSFSHQHLAFIKADNTCYFANGQRKLQKHFVCPPKFSKQYKEDCVPSKELHIHKWTTKMSGISNKVLLLNNFPKFKARHNSWKDSILEATQGCKTYQVWDEMRARGVKLDLISFTVIAYAAQKLHDREKISMLFGEMKAKGVKPDNVFHTCMIHVHSKEENILQALNCWDKMIDDECSPNVVTYTILINRLCKSGYLSSAEILCKEMLAGHFLPNSYTYICFLDYLANEGELEKAKVLHAAMLEGCLANTVTFNTLIKGFCMAG
jgi:pentatricopeptide repeat protein